MIGELGLTLTLPRSDPYLWDCATLASWRSRGVYPRLLQVNLAAEAFPAMNDWIIHAPREWSVRGG